MKSLKEILNTPLEEMDSLNKEELDIYIESIVSETVPSSDYMKVNQHVYRFKVKDLLYQVEITESLLPTSEKMIEIKFKLLNNPSAPKRVDFKTDQQYQIALQKSQIGISGTGNPHGVFARVMGVLIESINSIQPDYITFTADEESRQNLYERMLKLMSKYSSIKYNKISINPLTGDKVGNEEFWLERM
jgi:hypothetical protein